MLQHGIPLDADDRMKENHAWMGQSHKHPLFNIAQFKKPKISARDNVFLFPFQTELKTLFKVLKYQYNLYSCSPLI